MDTLSSQQRSWNMSRIKASNTGPERIVRSILHRMGYRFRLHRKDLPGKPDIVLPKFKTVVFVNGCFWHGHACSRGKRPSTNLAFWDEKIEGNVRRDRCNLKALKASGWRSVVVWQCWLKPGSTRLLRKLMTISGEKGHSSVPAIY